MKLILPVVTLLAFSTAVAQPNRPYAPGDTIKLAVTFEGPNVPDLRAAQISLYNLAPFPHETQEGFLTQLNGGQYKRVSESLGDRPKPARDYHLKTGQR